MNHPISFQKFKKEDLNSLLEITPEGWEGFSKVFTEHLGQNYFFPIKLNYDKKIVGVGELVLNGKIGWLGNIVVDKNYRNQGFGKKITERLIEMAKERNCDSIYLLATSLGKYVYQKLGFKENGEYPFYQSQLENVDFTKSKNIFRYSEKYQNQIFNLDKIASGEDRQKVITRYLQNSFVWKREGSENISGYFLPDLGNGLIIANSDEAGFDLIKKREQLGMNKIILPSESTTTIEFLEKRGYSICRDPATFMYIGKTKNWNPKMIYCRIGGWIG